MAELSWECLYYDCYYHCHEYFLRLCLSCCSYYYDGGGDDDDDDGDDDDDDDYRISRPVVGLARGRLQSCCVFGLTALYLL